MLHGKVLRSPHSARADPRDRHLRGARDGGRRRDPHRRRPRRHRALLRPCDQGSPDRRDRPRALRGRAGGRGRRRDEATAEAAVRAIEVDYELLPVLGTVEQALAPRGAAAARAPSEDRALPRPRRARRAQGNVCYRHLIESGDIERWPRGRRSWSRAPTPSPRSTSTRWRRTRRSPTTTATAITLWANCQHPFLVQAEIADLFGMPIGSVRIVVPYLGGGFGSKSYTKMEPLTVALARKAGRPVRIVNRVEESMVTSRRHGMRCWMRTSAAADGDAARARGALLDGHRRLRRQRSARRRDRRRRRARALPLRCRPRPGRLRVLQHAPVGVLPRVRRDAPAVDRRVPARRGRAARRASTRSSCAGAASSCRASPFGRTAPASRWTRISSAMLRRLPPRSGGMSRAGHGWAAASASGCSRRARTRSRARRCGCARTARRTSTSARRRWARARAR